MAQLAEPYLEHVDDPPGFTREPGGKISCHAFAAREFFERVWLVLGNEVLVWGFTQGRDDRASALLRILGQRFHEEQRIRMLIDDLAQRRNRRVDECGTSLAARRALERRAQRQARTKPAASQRAIVRRFEARSDGADHRLHRKLEPRFERADVPLPSIVLRQANSRRSP
jgi:hypothetical protein